MVLLTTCQPGLEAVVAGELTDRGLGSVERVRSGMLRVQRRVDAGDVSVAHRMRTADDLYLQIWAGDRDGFTRRLAAATWVVPGEVLAAHRDVLAADARRPQGRIKASCFIQGAAGVRRQAVEERMVRQLRAAYPAWRLDAERPDAEFVAFLFGSSAMLALRLTDPAFRHRHYRRAPGALSPTVAAALVRLSRPAATDRLLDPCCGGGTILLERAQTGPYRELLGGDRSRDALEVARSNFGSRHRPWRLQVWDARALPLPDRSVDRVVSNLPFGVQVAAPGGVAAFASACLGEVARVLEPGGRAVLLWPKGADVGVPPGLGLESQRALNLVGQAVVASVWERRLGPVPGGAGARSRGA